MILLSEFLLILSKAMFVLSILSITLVITQHFFPKKSKWKSSFKIAGEIFMNSVSMISSIVLIIGLIILWMLNS